VSIFILAVAAIYGCDNTDDGVVAANRTNEIHATYLCVGMEFSDRFGLCPGCEKDARNLANLMFGKYGYRGVTLISSEATKSRVVQELKKGISQTGEDGLFLFLYSGHGGQERLGGSEPDGADLPDEFLCLYDTYMLDDEIWDIVSKCKGRVFMYFDACHSATMYRSVSVSVSGDVARALSVEDRKTTGFTFSPRAVAMSEDAYEEPFRMMCWSGCKEFEYSYGSSNGGIMTNILLSKWRSGKSYGDLWGDILKDMDKTRPDQHPICTTIGNGFDTEAFK
jgi:hypothetical protein